MALKLRWSGYHVPLIYTALSLLVMLPLLKPGFVLTLDMVFTPRVHVPAATTSSYLFYAALRALNYLVPADVLQKIVLFAILLLSGLGMHRLITFLRRRDAAGSFTSWGVYAGGMLYMVNPFTYSRFMAGQFAVLLGYSLLPFFIRSLLALLRRPSWSAGAVLAAWMTLIGIVSIHNLGLVGVLFATATVLTVWRERRHRARLLPRLKFLMASVILTLVASSYWLVPLVLGHSTTAQAIAGFGVGDERAFATLGGSAIGKLANIVRLQGFWAEGHDLFVLPQAHMIGWGVVVLALWLLALAGIVSTWRRRGRFVVVLLLVSAGTGVLLAMGIANRALGRLLPFFGGFREPHKFVGLLALAYALFAGLGVAALLERYERDQRRFRSAAVLCAALLLPVLLTPTMFWGFGGQLRPREYPAAWYAMNARLNRDPVDFQVLFLPWHLYMYYDFAGAVIASPAPDFFGKKVVVNNQPELGGASPTFPDAQKDNLGRLLSGAAQTTHLGAQLAPRHIKYVLLDKDDDYHTYGYLDRQSDLRLVTEDNMFKLYLNTAYRGRK